MRLPVEVIEAILKRNNNDTRKFAEELDAMGMTRGKVNEYLSCIRDIEEDAQRQIKECQKHITAIQQACKHQWTIYHGDPAGGSDSHTSCEICGCNDLEDFERQQEPWR